MAGLLGAGRPQPGLLANPDPVMDLWANLPDQGGGNAVRAEALTNPGVNVRDAERVGGMVAAPGTRDALANYAGLLSGFVGSSNPIRAYHGSPHRFDRFDMGRIGTGEGAQAYGHGLYFAGNEGVARSYRDALSHPTHAPEYVKANLEYQNVQREITALHNRMVEESRALGARPTQNGWGDLGIEPLPEVVARFRPEAEALAARGTEAHRIMLEKAGLTHNPGHMYEVNLRTSPDRLLDWDAPLSQQPQAVQRNVQEILQWQKPAREALAAHRSTYGDPAGRHVYNALEGTVPRADGRAFAGNPSGGQFAASELRDSGIDGIRYLDAGSRAAGEGSRNYVMFDDKLIDIIRRYGLAPLLFGGPAASGLLAAPETQQ